MAFIDPGDATEAAAQVRDLFRRVHGREPDVVARAPGRVNLIGEHTDYNGGLCLPLALAHATTTALSRRDDDRVHVVSAQDPLPWEGELADVGPGTVTGWAAYVVGVLWAMRESGLEIPGADICLDSTVPLGAGLSSSAALECSVAAAVAGLVGLELTPETRRALARACVRGETEVAGAPTGGMDQTVAMLAEPGCALLLDFDADSSRPVPLDWPAAGLGLLVTDTRVSHALTDGGYGARRADCERAAALLGVPSLRQADLAAVEQLGHDRIRRRARHVVTEIARVERAVTAIQDADWAELGRLFEQSHTSMRDDFEISCLELDTVVAAAVEAGAVGARMTGGGFGGSAIALVPADRLEAVAAAVDARFVAEGFRAPVHLTALASGAADACPG